MFFRAKTEIHFFRSFIQLIKKAIASISSQEKETFLIFVGLEVFFRNKLPRAKVLQPVTSLYCVLRIQSNQEILKQNRHQCCGSRIRSDPKLSRQVGSGMIVSALVPKKDQTLYTT
jgi:hypothetical protein